MKNNTAEVINVNIPELEVVTNALTDRQINNRVLKIAALDEQIKALEEAKAALKAELIAAIGEGIETDKVKVHNTTVTSNRFDSTRFKKDHPDVYAEYTKASTSTRFSYSIK